MSTFNDKIKEYFELYAKNGFVCIPLANKAKNPALKKGELDAVYQNKYTPNLERFEENNIGIVTGRSGLIIFDADNSETVEFFEKLENFKKTLTVKTRRGKHYYYKIADVDANKMNKTKFTLSNDEKDKEKKKDIIHIDVQTGGSYVVAPPSLAINDKDDNDKNNT